ncbi:MAG: tRNA (adenosine(37)-N6)-threonylcarbamoyltransferase complex transferase subunit TsaD [Candidatus Omnitrophica bacterium]|nr:tRNA (adenosine(37)-N6)-threonylcarbamoyltransferase complex transferase subunit TsaD [Candidatus Omnitrophota bacterium]
MLVLGIETSCDETAAAVIKDGRDILSNVVSSSVRYHKRFGGVIPEIATRHHVENIDRVIDRSLTDAGILVQDIDTVAVTQGPGLLGALVTGLSCAKAIAYSLNVPLVAVDHVRAHIYSAMMQDDAPGFPFIGLVISGGHARLSVVEDFDKFTVLGDTLDDAIGEAYDKVAKILGLGYPGGPVIDRLAKKGDPIAVKFTCRPLKDSLDFSFSGIKTAVLYHVRAQGPKLKGRYVNDIAASFQEAALKVIVGNSLKAMEERDIKTLVIGGGVSANSRFREMITEESRLKNFRAYFPPLDLCSDNAVMIAGLAYRMHEKGTVAALDIKATL